MQWVPRASPAVLPVLLAVLRIVKSDENVLKVNGEGRLRAKNMAPLNAPRGTLMCRLVGLMMWLELNVKLASCELLLYAPRAGRTGRSSC